jgi:hypothetical protein
MVNDRDQFREKNIMIRRNIGAHGIVDAWWNAVRTRMDGMVE